MFILENAFGPLQVTLTEVISKYLDLYLEQTSLETRTYWVLLSISCKNLTFKFIKTYNNNNNYNNNKTFLVIVTSLFAFIYVL